jgi:hypothetical protein
VEDYANEDRNRRRSIKPKVIILSQIGKKQSMEICTPRSDRKEICEGSLNLRGSAHSSSDVLVPFLPEGGATAHVAASRRHSRERQSSNGERKV